MLTFNWLHHSEAFYCELDMLYFTTNYQIVGEIPDSRMTVDLAILFPTGLSSKLDSSKDNLGLDLQ